MQVSSTSSSVSRVPSSNGGGDIAKLQKQLRELADELKGVATSNLDEKAKREKVKLLQAQIQMVHAQIAAIQRARQQEQRDVKTEKSEGLANTSHGQQGKSKGQASGLGGNVDMYV